MEQQKKTLYLPMPPGRISGDICIHPSIILRPRPQKKKKHQRIEPMDVRIMMKPSQNHPKLFRDACR